MSCYATRTSILEAASPRPWSPGSASNGDLLVVAIEAFVSNESSRKIDDLVTALGTEKTISKSEINRLCKAL